MRYGYIFIYMAAAPPRERIGRGHYERSVGFLRGAEEGFSGESECVRSNRGIVSLFKVLR